MTVFGEFPNHQNTELYTHRVHYWISWAMSHHAMLAMLVGISSSAVALNVVDVGTATASKLLPFENKDAFFSAPPRYFGVFDGVSQCPQSRAFAQTLAKESSAALSRLQVREDDFGPQAADALLAAATVAVKYDGCSTACLLRLDLDGPVPQVSCYNLGDCGVMLLRSGQASSLTVAECTEAKVHANGAPYQLGGERWETDSVDDGESFTFDLLDGDVLLAFTDGLGDNLQQAEIAQIVSSTASADAMAKALVDAARERRRVDDDVTCVALRLGRGGGVSIAPSVTEESPWEKFGLRPF